MLVFGIPLERVVLGIVGLFAFGRFYDTFIVD